ncbi:TPA: D-hexose-6-phosphate mutarotase [Mannheimia haemolytica]|uniref:glucose-6-phosphate 1-epimerase n=7 Tax=Mannheimia haemolytica TaxID=75985 RepID=A0A249A0S5_MANHA|nr:D-hexose-6-phosphate mutarotase [Mannheimia haemolytica]AWW71891.1 D-hexose-6-phosphate mutarotase [Pasteurellaceae bacterium 12565]AGI33145.1 D-hexose-6-phosphate mutarotase [Mannheimia haemolytica USDA-ARS-USMARC-183]AGI34888.1 D-hexose-6-phosphate mutarotase [Mannheimia haemolytica USDA-ARS-USMARC-185]AGK01936.1 glucose-6-phosphate 1-epimerase [Mannheimia haemolytica M42548]AGQ26717.1 aldose 1-epimerase [Mannheimia haemolytica D153]
MNLSNALKLIKYNELDVLEVNHNKFKAKIALQGAQLLSWQPYNAEQDVLWLSEIEPFRIGSAIRGGIPICYPWFGSIKEPAHGTARIQEWRLVEHTCSDENVGLVFALENKAKMEMMLGETCELYFTHLDPEPAQLALHSYFNIGDIEKVEVQGLPTRCFDKLTDQEVEVPSPRKISENVDCIYPAQAVNFIQDFANQRTIKVEHINATETVLWNPWHNTVSAMTETAYQNMVCVETARINTLLQQNETLGVRVLVR